MKRILIFAAAAIAAVSCGHKMTNQEKLAVYEGEIEKIMEEYYAAEDKAAAEDIAINKIVEVSLETMRKNPKDSVALYALEECSHYAEPEALAEAIGCLSDELQESSFVKAVKENINTVILTGEGKPFVNFTVDHVSGVDPEGNPIYQKVSLSDYVGKGKYMLVDFWSPWCVPCKREIPNLKNVYEKYHGDNFDVLSIAVWEESRQMSWRNTIDTAAAYGINWNQINNGKKEPTELYGIDGIPHVILFGPDGTILKRDLYGKELENAVAAAVAK